MMMRSTTYFLVSLIIFLSACGTKQDVVTLTATIAAPTATRVATATASPTALRPTPIPTAEPTATIVYAPFSAELTSSTTNIHPLAPITIHFSRPITNPDIKRPVRTSPQINSVISWDDTYTTLTIQPTDSLPLGRSLKIRLDDQLRGAGDSQLRETEWSVRVTGGTQLLQHLPNERTLDELQPTIRLTFSDRMDRASVLKALSITPPIDADFSWDGNRLSISPKQPLTLGETYQFVLARTALSAEAVSMTREYRWIYILPPLVKTIQYPDRTNTNKPLTLTFNYTLDWQAMRDNLQIIATDSGEAIAGDIEIDESAQKVTFTPHTRWGIEQAYKVGNAHWQLANGQTVELSEPITFVSAPAITRVSPATDKRPARQIKIFFDRAIDHESAEAAFSLTPNTPGELGWQENTLIFTPTARILAENTTYTIRIETTIRSADNKAILSDPFIRTFTTRYHILSITFGVDSVSQVVRASGRRTIQYAVGDTDLDLIDFTLYAIDSTLLARLTNHQWSAWLAEADFGSPTLPLISAWRGDEGGRKLIFKEGDNASSIAEVAIPPTVPNGFYILVASQLGLREAVLLVNVSDLALLIKSAESQHTIWVS
ncbi:MAG TPA: hypothetical protein ENJ56_03140, partial [Anaerolineae bacterium]|nr:hypothetical protein [Anaerolineae bacterium]